MPLTVGVTVTGDADAWRPWRFVDVIIATKKETSHVRPVAVARKHRSGAGRPLTWSERGDDGRRELAARNTKWPLLTPP